MSWREALAMMAGGAGTTANRKAVFDTVARAHLFGPPGFQWSPEGLRVVRELRWELLATGTPTRKSSLVGHVLQVYGAAASAMSRQLSLRRAEPALNPALEAVLVEQVQCLAEAKVHGVRIQPWHVKSLLQSPLLSMVGPELALLVLQEVRDGGGEASHAPAEAVMDCAVGLASAGYAAAAWELLAPLLRDDAAAAHFPACIERTLRSHTDGHVRAMALVQQMPLLDLLEGGTRGWVDGAARACERHARHGGAEATSTAVEWVTQLVAAASRHASPPVSPIVTGAVLEAALRVLPLSAHPMSSSSSSSVREMVLAHNAQCREGTGAEVTAVIPVAKLGRFLRRVGQPEAYLSLLLGDAPEPLARLRSGDHTVLADVVNGAWADEAREPGLYTEVLLALAATGDVEAALACYDAWQLAAQSPASLTDVWSPPSSPAMHWCIVQLVLRPDTVGPAVHPLPLTDALYDVCLRALMALTTTTTTTTRPEPSRSEDSAARVSGGGSDDGVERALEADKEGLVESLVLWATARALRARGGETRAAAWQDAVLWAARAPTQHARYAQLIAFAAAAHARTAALTEADARDVSDRVARAEASMVRLATCLCDSPHVTRKQLCLLTASLSITLSSSSPSLCGLTESGAGDSPLTVVQDHDLTLALHPCVLDPLVRAFSAVIGDSQPVMDEVIQQTIDYYVSLRHRREALGNDGDKDEAAAWLARRVRGRAELLDSTLHVMAHASVLPVPSDANVDSAQAEDSVILAQVLRTVSHRTGLSMAHAAPAVVSAGLKADLALQFLA